MRVRSVEPGSGRGNCVGNKLDQMLNHLAIVVTLRKQRCNVVFLPRMQRSPPRFSVDVMAQDAISHRTVIDDYHTSRNVLARRYSRQAEHEKYTVRTS